MELNDFLTYAVPVYILELLAAIAGSYYLIKVPNHNKFTKYFVCYLWLTFVVEIICTYAPIGYFSGYEYFSFVKDTRFERNNWLYNCYFAVAYTFYAYFFGHYLRDKLLQKSLYLLAGIFFICSLISLITGDYLFVQDSKFINLGGTLLLFLSVILFYFELLKSNIILNLKRFLPIYLSVGLIVFYLCTTPLTIFSQYFNAENNIFVNLQVQLILYCNIFMYSTFIVGFIVCSGKKTSY
ncbi:hypothetical protein ATE92_2614 [Ulvibacter sp. MAR_2010_11]|nr:hypothetical protein ATE92_2614 [Ulvibacter sp. MAR_2010_11]